MPEKVEACVKKLMADPDFKPKKGKTKKESAYAVCQAPQKKAKEDVQEMVWDVPIEESFLEESGEGKSQKLRIKGTLVTPTVSRNKRKYSIKNLEENDKQKGRFIYSHPKGGGLFGDGDYFAEDHVIGTYHLDLDGKKLKYEGSVMNTPQHPNVVAQVQEGFLSPSLGASFKKMTALEAEEGEEPIYEFDGLDINHIGLVAIPGIKTATLAQALESYSKAMDVKEMIEPEVEKTTEVIRVEEPTNDGLKETLETLQEELKSLKQEKKESFLKSVKEKFDISDEELALLSCEQLEALSKVSPRVKETEDEPEPEPKGEVAPEEPEVDEALKALEGKTTIRKDEEGSYMTFSKEEYGSIMKELRERLPIRADAGTHRGRK